MFWALYIFSVQTTMHFACLYVAVICKNLTSSSFIDIIIRLNIDVLPLHNHVSFTYLICICLTTNSECCLFVCTRFIHVYCLLLQNSPICLISLSLLFTLILLWLCAAPSLILPSLNTFNCITKITWILSTWNWKSLEITTWSYYYIQNISIWALKIV